MLRGTGTSGNSPHSVSQRSSKQVRSDPCLADGSQGSVPSGLPWSQPWGSSVPAPGSPALQAASLAARRKGRGGSPRPCCPVRHRRRQFLPTPRHECQLHQVLAGSRVAGSCHLLLSPDPCAWLGELRPALGSGWQARQGRAGAGLSTPTVQPLPEPVLLSSPHLLGFRRHQRMPGQQRRLRPFLPQHRGQLRVWLPERLQAADRRADVPG